MQIYLILWWVHRLQVENRLSMADYFCVTWCGLCWPWAACTATARIGGRKRTCFPCRCPCACT